MLHAETVVFSPALCSTVIPNCKECEVIKILSATVTNSTTFNCTQCADGFENLEMECRPIG